MEVRDVTSESVLLYVDHCHKAPAVMLCVHRFVLILMNNSLSGVNFC